MNKHKISKADSTDTTKISLELQQAWLRQLQKYYKHYNSLYLSDCLQMPIFCIGNSKTQPGSWHPYKRTITISIHHILTHPWETVLHTLRHEMAHQYVDEELEAMNESPHGRAFAETCHLLRCDPGSRYRKEALGNIATSKSEEDRILTRIKQLLALGGSPNKNEAERAMKLANRELLKYKLKFQDLQQDSEFNVRYLRHGSAKIQHYQQTLAHILQDHFYVYIIQIRSYNALKNKRESIFEISGTPQDLDIAEYVYHYLMRLGKTLWERHKHENSTFKGTKLQYLAGLMTGFKEKLDDQKNLLKEEKGLVWLGDNKLQEYFQYRHPHTRIVYRAGVTRNRRFAAGQKDGKEIVIKKPIEATKHRGRLLKQPNQRT